MRRVRYTKKLGKFICEQIVQGKTLKAICENDAELPTVVTIMKWATNPEHHFYPMYKEAREKAAELLVDDIVDLADNCHEDNVQKTKVQIETRKWIASKRLDEVYGDKSRVTGSGGDGEIVVRVNANGDGLEGREEGVRD